MTIEKEFHNMTFKGDTMYFREGEYASVKFVDCSIKNLALDNAINVEFINCDIKNLDLINCFGVTVLGSSIDSVIFYDTTGLVTIRDSNVNGLYFGRDFRHKAVDLMLDRSEIVLDHAGREINITADKLSNISGNISKGLVNIYSYKE